MLYAYGGIFAPLGSSPKQEYFVGSKLTNEDAIFLIGHDGKSLLPNFMAGNVDQQSNLHVRAF